MFLSSADVVLFPLIPSHYSLFFPFYFNVAPDARTPAAEDLELIVERACVLRQEKEYTPRPDLLREYQSLVGALLYCSTNTRPDVAYAVGQL